MTMKTLFVLVALTILGATLIGCRAEGEVGESRSNVSAAR
jgi:hypothetical protein